MLNELSQELKLNFDSRLISSQVMMLKSSIQIESEDSYSVIELSQNVNMKTWLNDQFSENRLIIKLSFKLTFWIQLNLK